jgi:hypothetical protein
MEAHQDHAIRVWRFAAVVVPLIHLCACIAIALSDSVVGDELLVWVDFPFSAILFLVVGWSSHHLLLWFGIFGTLWWYIVVRFVEIEWNRFASFARKRNRDDSSRRQ